MDQNGKFDGKLKVTYLSVSTNMDGSAYSCGCMVDGNIAMAAK